MQLGGLHRKPTVLNKYRQSGLVVVDSGDLLNEDEELSESVIEGAKLKAQAIMQMYNKIGIDAVNVGELDLVLGVDYLKELAAKEKFPFISANLVDKKGAPIFKRYVIKNVNGKNIGIFGVIGDTSEMSERVNQFSKGAASVTDPLEAAESIIKELSGKVDYMIALTHQGTNRDWVIARRIKGINLVVGGHDKQKTKEPNNADGVLIVQAGEKGQYLGLLEVAMDATKAAKNTLEPLAEEIASDPAIKARISKLNDDIAEAYTDPGGSKPSPSSVSLRLTACEPCHGDVVTKWKATDHAKAYDTLVKKSKNFDPKCLACHTTRFDQPEGFSMKQQQMELVNVQCESCHGFAKEHLKSPANPIPTKKPTLALCIKCHTPDRCPGFDKDIKKLKMISH